MRTKTIWLSGVMNSINMLWELSTTRSDRSEGSKILNSESLTTACLFDETETKNMECRLHRLTKLGTHLKNSLKKFGSWFSRDSCIWNTYAIRKIRLNQWRISPSIMIYLIIVRKQINILQDDKNSYLGELYREYKKYEALLKCDPEE